MSKLYLFLAGLLLSASLWGQLWNDPLNVYVIKNHFPYQIADFDSLAITEDSAGTNLRGWGRFRFKQQHGNTYIAEGYYSNTGSQNFDLIGRDEGSSYRIYKLKAGTNDTTHSMKFFRDGQGIDTASVEYLHSGTTSPRPISRQTYFYRADGQIDSMFYEGLVSSLRANVLATKYYYNATGRLDSVESWEQNIGFRYKNVFAYDANDKLLHEDIYEDIMGSYSYFGRDIMRYNASGAVVQINKLLDVNGSTFDIGAWYFQQSPQFNLPEESISWSLYPNPSDDFIYLSVPEAMPLQTVKIYSLNGSVLMDQPMSSVIDVRHLPRGSYHIQILKIDNQVILHQKFQKR